MAVGTLQSNAKGIVPVGTLSGGPGNVPMLYGYEAASQDFKTGAVLILSSGKLTEASADPVANIIGVAAGDATGVTDSLIPYYPAGLDIVWEATLEDQTNEDHALVIANMYTLHALQTDTPGNWYVDENDTTATCCMIIAPRDWDDVTKGTIRARVKFLFIEDATARHKD